MVKEAAFRVKNNLAKLETAFAEATAKRALEDDVDMCEKKLVRAKQLIDGLGGEQSRWTHNVAQLSEDYENVTGNVLMSAGLIAYLGLLHLATGRNNTRMGKHKERKVHTPKTHLFFERLATQLSLVMECRFTNRYFSVDNAIVVFNSRRWP